MRSPHRGRRKVSFGHTTVYMAGGGGRKLGCTHSRNYRTKRCRSSKEHERHMKAYKARVSSSAKGRIKSSLTKYALAKRKQRRANHHSSYYERGPLRWTSV